MPPNLLKKLREIICRIFFGNLVLEFISVARILPAAEVVKYHPTLFVKFFIPILSNKLTAPISIKFFNFNKFGYDIDLHFLKQTQIVYCVNLIILPLLIGKTNI